VPHKFNFFFGCNDPIWLAHHKKKLELRRLPKIEDSMERWRCLPLWPTYIGEKGRTLGKTYRIKMRCYWEHLWGTHWEPREHVGNKGKMKKNPPPPPLTIRLCGPNVQLRTMLALQPNTRCGMALRKFSNCFMLLCLQIINPTISPDQKWWSIVLEIKISCSQWEASTCAHDGPWLFLSCISSLLNF
jgi:hypothetical protein